MGHLGSITGLKNGQNIFHDEISDEFEFGSLGGLKLGQKVR